jgi:cellulose synthase operon protein C
MSSNKKRQLNVTESLGLNAVEAILLRMGWQPRDQRAGDYGVDLQAEMPRLDGTASGRLLALQVKAGPSYFTGNKREVQFYADKDHIDYWVGHSLPVVVVFHNTETEETIWQWADQAVRKGKRWRLTVPRTQILDVSVKDQFAKVVSQGRLLDPATVSRLGEDVAETASTNKQGAVRPNEAIVSVPSNSQTVPPRLRAEVGDGSLSPTAIEQLSKLLDEKLRPSQPSVMEASSGTSTDPRRVTEDAALHAQIDQLRDIKNAGNPGVAYRMLLELLPKIDRTRVPYGYFRARTNLAACALDIGLSAEAVEGFEEAYEIETKNPLAIANLGLAKLLKQQYQDAFDLAKQALNGSPCPTHAITVLLSAAARLEGIGDPESLIPEAVRGGSDARFAVLEFLRVTEAPDWIEKAIEAYPENPDDPAFKRLWAYAILEAATTDRQFVPGGQSKISVAEVSEAAVVLRAEVEKKIAGGYVDNAELANEATNAAIAFRVVDDYQSGIDLLRRVQSETGRQPNAARMLALLEALNGNEAGALAALESIPDDGEAQLLKAEIIGRSDPKAALRFVIELDDATIPEHHRTSRWIVAANLAIVARDRPALDAAIEQIRIDSSRSVYADILSIRWRAEEGEADDVLAGELAAIAEALPADASFAQRVTVAQALKSHDAAIKASRVLDGHVDLTRDTEATRLYIGLLASSGRARDFNNAIAILPKAALDDPDIVWLRAVQAFNRGDLDQAEKHARHLTSLKPDILKPTLLLLESLVRRRRDAAIKRVLAASVEDFKSDRVSDQMRLARLLIGFGSPQRGLALLYHLLLENRDDPQLWTSFGALVLDAGRKKGGRLDAPAIADDISVVLTLDGGKRLEFIVEPNPELRRLDPDAREPSHPDVVAVMGMKTGDEFTLPDGRRGRVGELRHKFVARMQAVLQQFEDRFPTVNGFKSIQVDVEAEGGLDVVKAMLKARSDFLDEEANSYETGGMPLAVFAYRVGTSTIDAAEGLSQVGRKFQVAIGEEGERAQATKSLVANARRGVVVDAQTFWTMWSLEVTELIEAALGKVHYSANTLLDLQSRLERLSDGDEGGLQSMSYQGGQVSINSVDAEDVRAAAENLRSGINWLEANAILSPVTVPDSLPDEMRAVILDMGTPLFDEVFIANENDLLLLVDDLRLRQWGSGLGVTRSCWLHWALGYVVDEKLAEISDYAVWSAKLLARGQSYLGLSTTVFFEALRTDMRDGLKKPSIVFETLTTCIGGTKADIESHVRVTAQIIYGLWRGTEFIDLREGATGILLRRVTAERYSDHGLILSVLMHVFRSTPLAARYIRDWSRGHFLKVA